MRPSTVLAGKPPALLEVRPLERTELPALVRYFTDATDADNDRMGVDKAKLRPPHERLARLETLLEVPIQEATSFYYAWRVDGRTIGHASLKNIHHGERADIHLHMWEPSYRGRGLGGPLFCLSVLDAYERFRLREMVCEPKTTNPMPNRLLAKVGFPLVKTYVGASSEISAETTLNRYEIRRPIAEDFLDRLVRLDRSSRAQGRSERALGNL